LVTWGAGKRRARRASWAAAMDEPVMLGGDRRHQRKGGLLGRRIELCLEDSATVRSPRKEPLAGAF